jgi:hypothetical protein
VSEYDFAGLCVLFALFMLLIGVPLIVVLT